MSEVAPDSFTPYLGFRAWMAESTEQGWRLRSVMHHVVWPVRTELVGTCANGRKDRTPHDTPIEKGCACGIYASDNAQAMATYALPNLGHPATMAITPTDRKLAPRIVGFVNLWGKLVECLTGARASHAYPDSLWVIQFDGRGRRNNYEEIAADLDAYGVPVSLITGGEDRQTTIRDMERLVNDRLPKHV